MGPSGTGKTFLAAGLCFDAVHMGYKAYFRTMEQIITTLKMKDFARTAVADYKRLLKAQLIVIDDIMLFPIENEQAVNFFNFINQTLRKLLLSSQPINLQKIGLKCLMMRSWLQPYWTDYFIDVRSLTLMEKATE